MEEDAEEKWAEISHEHVQECLAKISSGDPGAAFELAQLLVSRVAKKDIDLLLGVIEGLARQSAALGSTEAKGFLENAWPGLKPVLERRLSRTFRSDPQ